MKWFGASLAAMACVALGFGAAASLGRRARALEELLRAMRLFSRRILLLREPIREAAWALRQESSFFTEATRIEWESPEKNFGQALDSLRELRPREREAVLRLLADCGSCGMDEQENILSEGLGRLRESLAAAQDKAKKDSNLYRTLGFIAAAATLIIAL